MLEYLAWKIAYGGSIPGTLKIFRLPHIVQNGFGAHPAYPVATDSSSPRPTGRLWSHHLDLQPGLKMDGAKGYLKRP
jgi:hypothetical protein